MDMMINHQQRLHMHAGAKQASNKGAAAIAKPNAIAALSITDIASKVADQIGMIWNLAFLDMVQSHSSVDKSRSAFTETPK